VRPLQLCNSCLLLLLLSRQHSCVLCFLLLCRLLQLCSSCLLLFSLSRQHSCMLCFLLLQRCCMVRQ
jgi:hypothetical protein